MQNKDYKLIVIEGVDSSGKQTQSHLLEEKLKKERDVVSISFPNYKSESSSVVKMYLNGDFGDNPNLISPYAASTFFAVDRFASINGEMKKYFSSSNIIIADRYVTSNMVHQASKIHDLKEKDKFLDWLYDFEYNVMSHPKPDLVIFLDMPVEYARSLMKTRLNKIDNTSVKDIHERSKDHLQLSYDNAVYVANKYKWCTIKCVRDGQIRKINDISSEIYNKVKSIL